MHVFMNKHKILIHGIYHQLVILGCCVQLDKGWQHFNNYSQNMKKILVRIERFLLGRKKLQSFYSMLHRIS